MNRIGFASLLCLSVFALKLSAFDGASTATTDSAANAGTAAASGTAKTVSAKDIEELRKRIAEQEEQIKKLQESISAQRDLLETTVRSVAATPASNVVTGDARLVNTGVNPMIAPVTRTAQPSPPINDQPLSLKIGSTYLTPIGFLDATWVGRSTNVGSGIGTNFGGIPLNSAAAGHLTDNMFSVQNSRVGARFDALVGSASVLAYWESDFLGFQPTNVEVSSNADTFRLRLFYVDVKKGPIEILAGQSWSLMTPNRRGISAIPGDIFFSQDVDTNYQVGLTWARQAGVRFVYHAGKALHLGVALENPQQYIGGSSGGGTATLPSNLNAAIASQVNAGANNFATPAARPDIIVKAALDLGILHSELVGMTLETKTYTPAGSILSGGVVQGSGYHSTTGGGVSFNNNIKVGKFLTVLESASYGQGIGRYFFGQGPSVVINSDARPTNVKAAGGIAGAEATITKSTLLYGYWGMDYFGQANVWDPAAKKFVGYGYAGSSAGNNRNIEELTFGLQQTLWKDPRYGALAFFAQYSYLLRSPWSPAGAPAAGASQTTRQPDSNMLFLNLRYTLPGQPPKLK